MNKKLNIGIIGLGYVGLPLAVSLAKSFSVVGFDINEKRIRELKEGFDETREVSVEDLKEANIEYVWEEKYLRGLDVYIVTVPTPVDPLNNPDMTCLQKASATVGRVISKGSIVVYESTVYPGVTEDICGKIIEDNSKLICGQDFFLGYSPERINPGDKIHTVQNITKVISGQNLEVINMLKNVYGKVNNNNIFIAKDIKTAEAAKVIENSQRDINIAFINEITIIMHKLGLSIYDVLDAANTKWNFLNFTPGLVGGHCIGVDPYYLAQCATQHNYSPEVILAGRKINEMMGEYIASSIYTKLQQQVPINVNEKYKILILGVTFKENIPDIRNSKVINIIEFFKSKNHDVTIHDPHANAKEFEETYGIKLIKDLNKQAGFHCVIGAVAHAEYSNFKEDDFQQLLHKQAVLADIKRIWPIKNIPAWVANWSL